MADGEILGLLNSRVVSFLLRCITPSLDFNPGYVSRLVVPRLLPPQIAEVSTNCIGLKERVLPAGEKNLEWRAGDDGG